MTHNSFSVIKQSAQELEAITQAATVKSQKGKTWHFNALKHLELFMDDMKRAEAHEREEGFLR
jgi:hypothetical protein